MKDFIYNGLGFPIHLKGIKTREFRGEILPDINHRKLEDAAFKLLLWNPFHFSGAHLTFVRGYMGLSQKAFATALGLSTHATISGWEKKKDEATGMPGTAELVIRLLMADFIKENDFASHFKEFLDIESEPQDLELLMS